MRAYYKKWYRPDLQAIIIVGDVNVDQVEATIKKMFADVPAPVNPAKREQVSVPDNDLPLISIAKDKEASNTILYIFYKHDKLPNDLNRTIAGLVKDYIQQICASIMDERFDDILHQANPPFIYAEAYDDDNFIPFAQLGFHTRNHPAFVSYFSRTIQRRNAVGDLQLVESSYRCIQSFL